MRIKDLPSQKGWLPTASHLPDDASATPQPAPRVRNHSALRAAGRKDLGERAAQMEAAGDKREATAKILRFSTEEVKFQGCFIAGRMSRMGTPRYEVTSSDTTLDIVPTVREAFTLANSNKHSSFATIRIYEIRGIHPHGAKTCIFLRTNGRVLVNTTGYMTGNESAAA